MKEAIPHYKRGRAGGELEAIKQKLSAENKAELDKFSIMLLRDNGQAKVDKILRQLLVFYDVTGVNFYDKPTVEQRDCFLMLLNKSDYKDSYKRDFKVYLKKWLLWRWKDLSLLDNFPKLKTNGEQKITKSDFLTDEEIKKMLLAESNHMWRTLISLLHETGARPDELLSLQWKDISFNGEITDLQLITKKKSTVKTRLFPVKASTSFIKEWQQNNPEAKRTDLVFYNPSGDKLSTGGVNYHLKTLAEKCKIEKNVFSYLFRFMKSTEFYSGDSELDDRNAALLLGHSPAMAKIYHKTDTDSARNMLIEKVLKARQMNKETKTELEQKIDKQGEWIAMLQKNIFSIVAELEKADNKIIELEAAQNKLK